jgi:hypothetical protein
MGRRRFVSPPYACLPTALHRVVLRATPHHQRTTTLTKPPITVYSQAFFDFNYPDLSRWTKTIPNAARSCFITFGPGLSYFACAQGNGSVWAGVSSELTDKVQKAYDTPSTAALGMDGAWFVMWPDGYFTWKFYGNYGALDKILTEAAPRSVAVSIPNCAKRVGTDVQSSTLPSRHTTRNTISCPSRTEP